MRSWLLKIRCWVNGPDIVNLRYEFEELKNALERSKLLAFIRIIRYEKGMNLQYDAPKTISLEDLEKRIEALESMAKTPNAALTGAEGVRVEGTVIRGGRK